MLRGELRQYGTRQAAGLAPKKKSVPRPVALLRVAPAALRFNRKYARIAKPAQATGQVPVFQDPGTVPVVESGAPQLRVVEGKTERLH